MSEDNSTVEIEYGISSPNRLRRMREAYNEAEMTDLKAIGGNCNGTAENL